MLPRKENFSLILDKLYVDLVEIERFLNSYGYLNVNYGSYSSQRISSHLDYLTPPFSIFLRCDLCPTTVHIILEDPIQEDLILAELMLEDLIRTSS